MAEEIINKVANSKLEQIDFEKWLPNQILSFDIAPFLWQGFVIKEKEFRIALKEHDWQQYKDEVVAVFCSADAIIQPWVYMLVSSALSEVNAKPYLGDLRTVKSHYITEKINTLEIDQYHDAMLVIKGCSKIDNIENLLLNFVQKVQPVVKSIMFGEPCSTVPIYKQKRK